MLLTILPMGINGFIAGFAVVGGVGHNIFSNISRITFTVTALPSVL